MSTVNGYVAATAASLIGSVPMWMNMYYMRMQQKRLAEGQSEKRAIYEEVLAEIIRWQNAQKSGVGTSIAPPSLPNLPSLHPGAASWEEKMLARIELGASKKVSHLYTEYVQTRSEESAGRLRSQMKAEVNNSRPSRRSIFLANLRSALSVIAFIVVAFVSFYALTSFDANIPPSSQGRPQVAIPRKSEMPSGAHAASPIKDAGYISVHANVKKHEKRAVPVPVAIDSTPPSASPPPLAPTCRRCRTAPVSATIGNTVRQVVGAAGGLLTIPGGLIASVAGLVSGDNQSGDPGIMEIQPQNQLPSTAR